MAPNPNHRSLLDYPSQLSGLLSVPLGISSYHVVAAHDIEDENQSVLDGFIIGGGHADGDETTAEFDLPAGHRHKGGGLYAFNSKLNVLRCTFVANRASGSTGETGLGGGAAIEGFSSSGLEGTDFINCVFRENSATRGAALAVLGDARTLNPEFWPITTKASMTNCQLFVNTAVEPVNPPLPTFLGGTGTVYLADQTGFVMTNCTLSNNDAERSSPGLQTARFKTTPEGEPPEKVAVTKVRNSVFWNNKINGTIALTAIQNGADSQGVDPLIDAQYCILHGGDDSSNGIFHGTGTILEQDPLFVDAGANDYHIQYLSPAIDAGVATGLPTDRFDLDGDGNFGEAMPDIDLQLRTVANGTDLGVDEYFTCCEDFIGNDGDVGILEFLAVLAAWGECAGSCPTPCPEDFNNDEVVGILEFLGVLSRWGGCSGSTTGVCDECPLGGYAPVYGLTQEPSLALFEGMYGPVSDNWGLETNPSPPPTYKTTSRKAADDFRPVNDGTISLIHWWGFYEDEGADCSVGYNCRFKITYYESMIHPVTGKRVPDLGKKVAWFTDVLAERELESTMGESGPALWVYFASHADVNVTAGKCYFVQIQNDGGDTDAETGCHWRWAWSDDGDDLYSCRLPEGETSYKNAADPDHAMNLAFGLDILFDTEDPSGSCP